ncbi:MAG: glutamate-5-semialdehyde dehydrogenase [Anaerolineae bacterium]|nr:glutamate-5-semialdehyde dehydrogenase [Phycisphaerae bacterium]
MIRERDILKTLERVRDASRELRVTSATTRNRVLRDLAMQLKANRGRLFNANRQDLFALRTTATSAFRDRLALTENRLRQMIDSLKQVAAFADPTNEAVETKTLANGLRAKRVRSPLGVILMIFESRPDVAVEAFSLAFKSGNAIILRGGKESMRTTAAIYQLLKSVLIKHKLPTSAFWGITDADRRITTFLLKQSSMIDIVVPRGGDRLIDFVVTNTRIPIIKNDRGLCHVYVHADASLDMARRIVVNAKTQRPGVCNAMETLLVHRSVAKSLLPKLHAAMAPKSVEWLADRESHGILRGLSHVRAAMDRDFDTEHLDLKMNCRIVGSLDEAIAHIERHGSHHSESIVTKSRRTARKFQSAIDAAVVYWNASTRFTDGFALGLGGELGISTQKLHVRGPVGLSELTSVRWIIDGSGQVRE